MWTLYKWNHERVKFWIHSLTIKLVRTNRIIKGNYSLFYLVLQCRHILQIIYPLCCWWTFGFLDEAVITKYQKLHGLNNRNLFCHNSKSLRSTCQTIQFLMRTLWLVGSCPWLCPHVTFPQYLCTGIERISCLVSLIRTLILSHQGHKLMTSFNFHFFLRGPISKYC